MLLEFEIERITRWVETRALSPEAAVSALSHLMAQYLQARGLPLHLTLFERYALALFRRSVLERKSTALAEPLIERAWRMLGTSTADKSHVIPLPWCLAV
ncbi:hypothetical protein [Asticcacaulis sp. AND118]|uniref:hypothetical protein n=1 Tax=Asticcacaulis sp. AND118 TaxID=2840468 RepID=UPI001CFF7E13|nr:hypothetical protein [Asticcacaulis sp. AND118]UDF04879.1 hypothetical protein LH365_15905 [Asticcacaulis sp. AND118]